MQARFSLACKLRLKVRDYPCTAEAKHTHMPYWPWRVTAGKLWIWLKLNCLMVTSGSSPNVSQQAALDCWLKSRLAQYAQCPTLALTVMGRLQAVCPTVEAV